MNGKNTRDKIRRSEEVEPAEFGFNWIPEVLANTVVYKKEQVKEPQAYEEKLQDLLLEEKGNKNKLKLDIVSYIKWYLGLTSFVIFVLISVDGANLLDIDIWTIRLLVLGMVAQPFALLKIVAQHLFPNNFNESEL